MAKQIVRQLKGGDNPCPLVKSQVLWLCKTVQKIFMDQPMLLELRPPVTICGDIHGQYPDLLRIFEQAGYPPFTNYLFLGDYVDRGNQGIHVVCLLFALKISYPEHLFLLRGNHECSCINKQFGFYDECILMYDHEVWKTFSGVFNCLPVVAIVEDKIFCVHGGISPSLKSLNQIRNLHRPTEVPEEGLMCDLLWSDPDATIDDWDANDRGTSYVYGPRAAREFLERFGFDLICRAHQAVMPGYQFPYPDDQGVVTVFSAGNYCNSFHNKAAIMQVNEGLTCSFTIISPKQAPASKLSRPGTPPPGRSSPPRNRTRSS
jgi:serine/threonine-protein phosphatase PP1 catalytic subunit